MNPTPAVRRRELSRALLASFGVLASFSFAPFATAADGTWNADAGGNWTSGVSTNWASVAAEGADFTAFFNTVNITANRTVTLTAPLIIGNLAFGDATTASHDWTLAQSGGSVLTLQTTTGTPTITIDNRTATISAGLAGNQGFTKAGTGRLILNGAHSLTGTLTVSAGTLDLWSTASTYANNINLTTTTSTLDAANTATGSTATISGNITGAGRINKTGSVSTMVLAGNNDFSGGVTLGAGTIVVGSGTNNGIGTGTLTLSGGALRSLDNASRTFSNVIAMGSNPLRFGGLQGDITGLGDLNFTWTGSASVGGNKTWTINNATTAAFANNWSGNSGWNVTKAGTGGLVFNGNLTGTGVGLVVSAGTMSLNGSANSYSGATTVNGGALFVDGVVTNSAITVNNGGRIGGLGSVGNVTFNAGAGLAYNVANVAQGGDGLTAASFTGAGVGGFTIFLGGAAAGFDDSANYTWTVLSSADVASISLSGITLDTSGFGQSFTGEFSVTKDAGSLHVNYIGSIVPEPSSAALLAGFGILGFTMTRRRRG